MIDRDKISSEWISRVSKENRKTDKILVEKVIRAFLLIEGLVKQNLSFIFKGGTALMLHLNSTRRLSIDIDIIMPEKPGNFFNNGYKCYHLTEHFDTTLLVC